PVNAASAATPGTDEATPRLPDAVEATRPARGHHHHHHHHHTMLLNPRGGTAPSRPTLRVPKTGTGPAPDSWPAPVQRHGTVKMENGMLHTDGALAPSEEGIMGTISGDHDHDASLQPTTAALGVPADLTPAEEPADSDYSS